MGKSTIRKWLNEKFYYTAFSQMEQDCILPTWLKNEDNPKYGTKGGNDTEDKIFLLSIEEAKRYFPSAFVRSAKLVNGDMTWWWLRSPGRHDDGAAYVDLDGNFRITGYDAYGVFDDIGGVRPALWFNLKSEIFSSVPLAVEQILPLSGGSENFFEKKKEEEQERKRRANNNLCQYCGGTFKGLLQKKCSVCGKQKTQVQKGISYDSLKM